MIQASNLSKFYGPIRAVDNLSFSIAKGEVVGILGPNGAGKTTLMRLLTCFFPPTAGSASIANYDIRKNPLDVKRIIGYLPENPPLYPEMKVGAYLRFCALLKGISKNALSSQLDETLELCNLTEVHNRPIRTLSKGFRQRVGIAQVIIHHPSLLILDEPTTGLDPLQIIQVRELIDKIKEKATIIISTHILQEIEAIAQRVIIMAKGKIVTDQPLNGLLGRAEGGKASLESVFLDLTNSFMQNNRDMENTS